MTKHVKLYEHFQIESDKNELKADLIFENVMHKLRKEEINLGLINTKLNEQTEDKDEFTQWLYTDEPLNAAESRAQAQGKQILNKRQMAVMYLAALGDYEYGDITEYIKVIPGLQDYDFNDMPKSSIVPILCEVFDVDSDKTFNLTMIKFKNHITGEVEDLEVLAKHTDYEKLRQVYYILEKKASEDGPNDIAAALADAVGSVNNLQRRLEDIEARRETQNLRAAELRNIRRQEDARLGEIVHELVKGFKDSTIPVKTYSSMIWKRLAEQYPNVNSMRMWDAYLKYLKDMKLSLMYYPINKPIVA